MKVIVIAAIMVLFASPVMADVPTQLVNTLAVEQAADCGSTAIALARGAYETNPMARPVVRSMPMCLAAAAVLNIGARFVVRYPVGQRGLRVITTLYPFVIGRNIGIAMSFANGAH